MDVRLDRSAETVEDPVIDPESWTDPLRSPVIVLPVVTVVVR
jgi:hypothetical protein